MRLYRAGMHNESPFDDPSEFQADDEIEHDGPIAPYQQLAAIITARIHRGDWKARQPLPSENRLTQEYELARSTVRRAIKLLKEKDLVVVVRGRGMYVKPPQQ